MLFHFLNPPVPISLTLGSSVAADSNLYLNLLVMALLPVFVELGKGFILSLLFVFYVLFTILYISDVLVHGSGIDSKSQTQSNK